jgi:uncharacterized protein YigE (DUF2233 family)
MNVLYRNSIGILPNGNILFIRSKVEMNFYNFAAFFKKKNIKTLYIQMVLFLKLICWRKVQKVWIEILG